MASSLIVVGPSLSTGASAAGVWAGAVAGGSGGVGKGSVVVSGGVVGFSDFSCGAV